MSSQKRKAKTLVVSLPPELDAAVRARAGPEGVSALVQMSLTASPVMLAEELRGLARLIKQGDTPVSVLAVEELAGRVDRVLRELDVLLRLRRKLERFLEDTSRRVTEAGEDLAAEGPELERLLEKCSAPGRSRFGTRPLGPQAISALLRGALADPDPVFRLLRVLIELVDQIGPERLEGEVERVLARIPKPDRPAAERRLDAATDALKAWRKLYAAEVAK